MVALSFVKALREKYMMQDDVSNCLILPKDKVISTDITFVGFGDVKNVQCQLSRLTSIDLSGTHIKVAGEATEFADRLGKVQTLNLANNNLGWHEVIEIVSHLPQLRDLILSGNDLAAGLQHHDIKRLGHGLVQLTLGRVNIEWSTLVSTLSSIWPNIDQIDLWDSSLTPERMQLKDLTFEPFVSKITALRLSQNNFPDLNWTIQMGLLGSLRELDVSRCGLMSIKLSDEQVSQLKNLEIINIAYNNITDWICISELNKLPNLKHLLCQENPLYILEKFAKPLTIARLQGLKLFNREEVSHTARRDSEIFYVRKVYPDYQSYLNGANTLFKSLHPRYEELVQSYGLPEDLTKKHQVDKYLSVDLCFGDARITRKLPCDMRISNLQMLCKRLFRLKPSSTIEITCVDPKSPNSALNYKLDINGQTLDFFSVKSGYELQINDVSSH